MSIQDVNFSAVAVATIVQFVVGAIWYTPLFGNVWGKIHGFDKLSKKEQAEARKSMGPLLVGQLVVTIFSAFGLVYLAQELAGINVYLLGLLAWFAFMVPAQVGAVLFGGTAPRWVATKIAVMVGGSFVCTMAAEFAIHLMLK